MGRRRIHYEFRMNHTTPFHQQTLTLLQHMDRHWRIVDRTRSTRTSIINRVLAVRRGTAWQHDLKPNPPPPALAVHTGSQRGKLFAHCYGIRLCS